MNVSFYTFGCTVNSAESQKIQQIFRAHGHTVTEESNSDLVIINSCAITASVEKNVQQLIFRLKRKNAGRVVAVVGCYGEMLINSGKTALQGADILLGNDKFDIYTKIQQLGALKANGGTASTHTDVSAYVQVQNGCDNRCSYCIVPHLRGGSQSKPLNEIQEEVQTAAGRGCRQVVLAGLNLGLYKSGGRDLMDILYMADKVDGIERIRLSSLEPMDIKDRFLNEFTRVEKLVSHLHISLQNGCNRILEAMNRNYSFEAYYNMLELIRKKVPGIAISTDIIVGFPGETEKDFLESMRNIISCAFSDIHIFKYSPRAGTPAALLPEQVAEHQKKSRAAMLKGIKWQARFDYNRQFIGRTEVVSLLRPAGASLWEGVAANNLRVCFSGVQQPNDKARVLITGLDDVQEGLTGALIT